MTEDQQRFRGHEECAPCTCLCVLSTFLAKHLKHTVAPRCALLGLLVVACGGHVVYEQPRSSLLLRHERMMWLCRRITASLLLQGVFLDVYVEVSCRAFNASIEAFDPPSQVFRINIWMWNFGAKTPKRTSLWSSSSAIQGFWPHKKLNKREYQGKRDKTFQPTKRYVDGRGKPRWQGTSDLTKTGRL